MCITAVFIFGVTCWSRSAVVQCFCVVCFMFYKLFSIIVFNTSWTRNRFLILSLYWLDCDSKGYSWTRSLYTIVWQQLFLFHVVKLPRLSPCLGFANSCPSCPLCLSHRKQSFNLDSLSWRQPVCLPLCCAQEHPAITLTVFPSWQIISNVVCAALSSETPSDSCELWASSVNARAVRANNLASGQPPSGDKPADSAAWRGPAPLGLSPTCVHRPLQSLMWWACESSCITLALTPF